MLLPTREGVRIEGHRERGKANDHRAYHSARFVVALMQALRHSGNGGIDRERIPPSPAIENTEPDPLAAIDEFVLLGAIDDFIAGHLRGWQTPSQLLGWHYANGNRCPVCRGRLMMRLPRIYSGRIMPGGPITDLAGMSLSVQTHLVGIGLRTSVIREETFES